MDRYLLPRIKQVYSAKIGDIWEPLRDVPQHEELLKAKFNIRFFTGTKSYIKNNKFSMTIEGYRYNIKVLSETVSETSKVLSWKVSSVDVSFEISFFIHFSTQDISTLLVVECRNINSLEIRNSQESRTRQFPDKNSQTTDPKTNESSSKSLTCSLENYISYIRRLMLELKQYTKTLNNSHKETAIIQAEAYKIWHFVSDFENVRKFKYEFMESVEYLNRSDDVDVRRLGEIFKLKWKTKKTVITMKVLECCYDDLSNIGIFKFTIIDSQPVEIPKVSLQYRFKSIGEDLTYVELTQDLIGKIPYDFMVVISKDMRSDLTSMKRYFESEVSVEEFY